MAIKPMVERDADLAKANPSAVARGCALAINGQWVTEYFRTRWLAEQNDAPATDLCNLIINLNRVEADDVVQGRKKLVTTWKGLELLEEEVQP